MSPRISITVVALAGLLAGVCGYVIGNRQPTAATDRPTLRGEGLLNRESPLTFTPKQSLEALDDQLENIVREGLAAVASGDVMAGLEALVAIDDSSQRSEALLEFVANLSADQISDLVDAIIADSDNDAIGEMFDSDLVGFALFDRWADIDPDGVFRFIENPNLEIDNSATQQVFIPLALAFAAQRDPARALEVARLPSGDANNLDNPLFHFAIMGIALKDPAAAIHQLRINDDSFDGPDALGLVFDMIGSRVGEALPEILQFPPGEERGVLLGNMFKSWGRAAPDEAMAAAMALEDDKERTAIVREVISAISNADPKRAAQLVASLPNGPKHDAMKYEVAYRWMHRDSKAAMEWAEQHLDTNKRIGLFKAADGNITPGLGMAILNEMEPEQRQLYFDKEKISGHDHFIHCAIADDPQATLAWLQEAGGQDAFRNLGYSFSQAVVGQSPQQAMALIENIEDERFRTQYISHIARQASLDDPAATMVWVQSLDRSSAEGKVAFDSSMSSWATEDPTAAAEYAQTQEDAQAISTVTRAWALQDAEAAFRWLHEMEGGDADALHTRLSGLDGTRVLSQWAEQNPVRAVEAVLGFPEDFAPQHIGPVFSSWAYAEPNRASAYINDHLEPGPIRDAAVQALVGQLQRDNLSEAAAWARTISNPGLMNSTLESLATE